MKEEDAGMICVKEGAINLTEFLNKPHSLFEKGIQMARAL